MNDDQKVRLCQICGEVGADYVKTSTGYGTGGATIDDLRLMRRSPPPHVKLKAAGGVRTLDAMIEVRRARLRPHRRLADRRDPRRAQGAARALSRATGSDSSRRADIATRRQARLSLRDSVDPFDAVVGADDQACRRGRETARFRARRRCTGAADRAHSGSSTAANWQSMIWLPPSVR